MTNFPYIFGSSKPTFTFSDYGYFRYPKQVTIPANVRVLNNSAAAFQIHTEIETIAFEENSSLTNISANIFQGCTGLKSIVFPANKTLTIPGGLFDGCTALENIEFPDCTLNIGTGSTFAFRNCPISQSLFETLLAQFSGTAIAAQMFAICSRITSLVVPDTITQIGLNAFMSCTNLSFIDLNNVTVLYDAFSLCPALKKVIFRTIPTTFTPAQFSGSSALEEVVIPEGWNQNLNLSGSSSLTHDSMVSMLENLYDFTGGTKHTLTLGATNLARLSAEEIAIATAKNWTVT